MKQGKKNVEWWQITNEVNRKRQKQRRETEEEDVELGEEGGNEKQREINRKTRKDRVTQKKYMKSTVSNRI